MPCSKPQAAHMHSAPHLLGYVCSRLPLCTRGGGGGVRLSGSSRPPGPWCWVLWVAPSQTLFPPGAFAP